MVNINDEGHSPFQDKVLAESPFAGDDGAAVPEVAQAIDRWSRGLAELAEVERALVGTRLLVPVVPVLGETGVNPDGLVYDKSSDLTTATFRSDAGWEALLAFTSVEAAQRWRTDARSVPARAQSVAAEALDKGCTAILLDFEGPQRVPITGRLLRALSQGRRVIHPASDPVVIEALHAAAQGVVDVAGATIAFADPLMGADVILAVTLVDGATPEQVHAALAAIAERVASDPVLRDRLDRGAAVLQDLGEATAPSDQPTQEK